MIITDGECYTHRFVSQWSLRDISACVTYRATPIYFVHAPFMLRSCSSQCRCDTNRRLKLACVTIALDMVGRYLGTNNCLKSRLGMRDNNLDFEPLFRGNCEAKSRSVY